MPASYVHQCVAGDACLALDLFSGDALRAAMLAGSEGPDPFFFSLFAPPGALSAPALGSLLHTKKTDDFLIALAHACAGHDVTRAYCCGFFSHYGTDTTFHPFVYAHSAGEDGAYSGVIHCTLEHGLETLHHRRRGNAKGLPYQMGGFIALTNEDKNLIAGALHKAVACVFPEHTLSSARVRKSFDDAVFLCNLLRSESGRKYRALGAIASLAGMDKALHSHMMPAEPPEQDIANDAHAPWASPWEPKRVRTEGFDELYAAAVSRAQALMPAALAFMAGQMPEDELRALTGANSYDSGLPWTDTRPAKEVFAANAAKQR